MKRGVPAILVLLALMATACGEPQTESPPPATQDDAFRASVDADALEQFQAMADRGDAEGQRSLAYMYYLGRGVEQDYGKALGLFRRAAEQGDGVAQMTLGVMYSEGQGVRPDLVEAHRWLQSAAASGTRGADERLEGLKQKMTPEQIARAETLTDD